MTKPPVLAIICALGFLAAACGAEDPLIQAMADEMVTQADGLSTDPAEALCVSEASYETLGADRLSELGITVDNPDLLNAAVTEDEAVELVEVLYSCVDVNEMVISQITAAGLPATAAECILESLGEDEVRALIVEQLQGNGPAVSSETQLALLSCLADDG